ncbi:hypothetical protein [Xanthobacter sp. ZOL 2024]
MHPFFLGRSGFLLGLAVGAGAIAFGPRVLRVARPLAKDAADAGKAGYEAARDAAAKTGTEVKELVSETAGEIKAAAGKMATAVAVAAATRRAPGQAAEAAHDVVTEVVDVAPAAPRRARTARPSRSRSSARKVDLPAVPAGEAEAVVARPVATPRRRSAAKTASAKATTEVATDVSAAKPTAASARKAAPRKAAPRKRAAKPATPAVTEAPSAAVTPDEKA